MLPRDILDYAKSLLKDATELEIPANACLCRNIVGRAYYAAYHTALAAARREGYNPSDCPESYGSHEALWEWWFSDRENEVDISSQADSLKAQRHTADYRLAAFIYLAAAQGAVDEAEEIINLVGQYAASKRKN